MTDFFSQLSLFFSENAVWIFLGVFLLLFLGLTYWKNSALNKSDLKFFREKWDNILREKDFRHQILDADKLLDKLLAKKGYSGSLGEKLKKARQNFTDYNGVWAAHKLRNKLAHELDFRISEKEANQALSQFRSAFKDLGLF